MIRKEQRRTLQRRPDDARFAACSPAPDGGPMVEHLVQVYGTLRQRVRVFGKDARCD